MATDPPSDGLLVSEREAARLLRVSPRTVYSLRKEGKLPFLYVGSQIRYSLEALAAWIAERQQIAASNLPERWRYGR